MLGAWLQFINLGSGVGVTILELIKQFEASCSVTIPYVLRERREGDVGSAYGDIERAKEELGWTPEKSLDDMCESCGLCVRVFVCGR